jgi:type I restriction enzyme S subunit
MKESWTEIKMVDACDILTCGVASTPKYVDESVGVPFLSAQNVRDGKIVLDKYRYISKEFHEHLTKKNKPQKGDILYSRVGAKFGEAGVVEHDFEFSVYVSVTLMRPKPELFDNYFFKNYLNSPRVKDIAKKSIQSSGVPNLNVRVVREFPIPIPPLLEQKQIVTILDKAFAAIDQAKANIERNIENAKELFQSKLNEIFIQKSDGWEEKKFQDVCVLQRGFDLPKRLRENGTFPLVSSSGTIDSHIEFKVKAPGVVTGRSGSIGNIFYIENDFWPLNTTLYIKDFKGNDEKYVYYFIKQFDLTRFSSGAGVPTLNRNFVHDEKVFSTDNIEEQKKIVIQLDSLLEKSDILVSQYKSKLSKLEELKKSILQKAFEGELTEKEINIESIDMAAEPVAQYQTKN